MKNDNPSSPGLKQSFKEAPTPEDRKAIADGLPYETGFGKPPRATRFKKGASPNPRGRPKGSKNLATILRDEGNQHVEVAEKGRQLKLTKNEVFIRQMFNKASIGDLKAAALIVETMRKTNQLEDTPRQTALAFDERDFQAAKELAQLFNQTSESEDNTESHDHESK
jgi:hypothetical protein